MTQSESVPVAEPGDAPPFRRMHERFRGYLPVVVDVETGGFDWQKHALLELAVVPIDLDENGRYIPGEVSSAHFETAPGLEIDPKSLEITGIRLDHVFAAVRAAVKKHNCQRAILVGHNAHFDLNFLNAAVARTGHKRNPFHPFSVFDTVTLGGVAFGQTVLARAVQAAGIDWNGEEAHSAVYDAEKTAALFCVVANGWSDRLAPISDRPAAAVDKPAVIPAEAGIRDANAAP